MKIRTTFKDNIIPYKYGKGATLEDTQLGYPVRSFPFDILDIPQEAQYLSFTLIDHDAVPLCGFSWIHWLAANIPVTASSVHIEDNLAMSQYGRLCQGQNSFASTFLHNNASQIYHTYVGPMPPDNNHTYTLTVYATKNKLSLTQGFYLNELFQQMKNHIVAQTTLDLTGLK